MDYRADRHGYFVSPGIYPGVRKDMAELSMGSSGKMGMKILPEWVHDVGAIIDLPFSFILDTLCLPYDISQAEKKEDKEQGEKNSIKSEHEHPLDNKGDFDE